MNDSNQTLRFSRTYQEATGKRIRRSDFAEPVPHISGRFALVWALIVFVLCLTIYLWR